MRLPVHARAAAGVLALALSAAAPARPAQGAASSAPGTWLLHVTANVRASPVVDERFERDVEVTLSPYAGSGTVRVRLESERYACDLAARLSAGGQIALDPGQRCTLDVREPTARGRVEARLESGSGRLRGDRMEIDVSWALSGSMSLLVGGQTMEVLGREVEVPATWMPEVPLKGTVRATGSGTRTGTAAAR